MAVKWLRRCSPCYVQRVVCGCSRRSRLLMSGCDSSPSKHSPGGRGVAVTADWTHSELSPSYHSSLVLSQHHQHCIASPTPSYLTLQYQPQRRRRRRRKLSEPDYASASGTTTAFVDLRSRDLPSQTNADVRSYYSMTSCGNADFDWTEA